ncbi:MAG: 16S rRNA (adenine(1518)-N(6)/adenine(1519)-N(6))-dimethyltransferase RsmA [Bacteroidales bacterium]|nr:16S rRNA (adenine(1518)-N(6)/adenine(1519)-N(6))-dimethyltransferase RsmA [Bacteroidales bacterium]
MSMLKPRKSLGQHFLTDKNTARKIVAALSAIGCNCVIEIGSGTGILTSILIEKKEVETYFVEIDSNAVNLLRDTYPHIKEHLIHGNFLELDLAGKFKPPLALIGNLPYNISSQVFFKILDNRNRIRETVCMVQKEVARRIASPPGNKDYGILSVLLQAYFDIEYLFTVNPGVFYPPPKVHSGVIRMLRNETAHLACDEEKFFRVVKTSFNQRRKIIRNSLQNHFVYLAADDQLLLRRPEQLSVSDFIDLTNRVDYKNTIV